MTTPDLVIAGNLLVDDIVTADGRTCMGEPGGAALYASLAASLWGVGVGIVSVHGEDYPQAALDALAAHAVDVSGVHPLGGPGLRTWLLYEPHGRRVVHQLGAATHEQVSPGVDEFPRSFERARCVHLAPLPFVRQRELVVGLRSRMPNALLSLDPYRPLTDASLLEWQPVLAGLDLLFVSDDEFQLSNAAEQPREALERLIVRSEGYVVLKRGERGGMVRWLAHEGPCTFDWSARAASVTDPTGAGDAFAAGFLAGLVREEPEGLCCARGVVSASFALEDWGARALLRATRDDATRRLEEWFPIVRRHTRP